MELNPECVKEQHKEALERAKELIAMEVSSEVHRQRILALANLWVMNIGLYEEAELSRMVEENLHLNATLPHPQQWLHDNQKLLTPLRDPAQMSEHELLMLTQQRNLWDEHLRINGVLWDMDEETAESFEDAMIQGAFFMEDHISWYTQEPVAIFERFASFEHSLALVELTEFYERMIRNVQARHFEYALAMMM